MRLFTFTRMTIIPADYDPLAPEETSTAAPAKPLPRPAPAPRVTPLAAPAPAPAPAPVLPRPGVGRRTVAEPPAPTRDPFAAESASPAPRSEPPPTPRQEPAPRRAMPSSADGSTMRTPAVQRAPAEEDSNTGGFDFAAFLDGAGVQGVAVSPELARDFGQIVRVIVEGLMEVLRARERIKSEFRMRSTTFKSQDNNPLKYSANVEDALHNLLVKRNAAYLGPVAAFEDAFRDVRNHQMAMLAGVRVAYEAMLAEFDPERLQEEFDKQLKGRLGAPARLKYWDLYAERFRDRVRDADSCFRDLFGDEFAKAYEEQLARLRTLQGTGGK